MIPLPRILSPHFQLFPSLFQPICFFFFRLRHTRCSAPQRIPLALQLVAAISALNSFCLLVTSTRKYEQKGRNETLFQSRLLRFVDRAKWVLSIYKHTVEPRIHSLASNRDFFLQFLLKRCCRREFFYSNAIFVYVGSSSTLSQCSSKTFPLLRILR